MEKQINVAWFSHKGSDYDVKLLSNKEFVEIADSEKIIDWDNCNFLLARSPSKKLRLFIRRNRRTYSEYNKKIVNLTFMLSIDVNSISAPIEENYHIGPEKKDLRSLQFRSYPRYVFQLDNTYWIWEWKKNYDDIKQSKIYKIYLEIKSYLDTLSEQEHNYRNVIPATFPHEDRQIIPVIYQPALDGLKNFVREIHCWKTHDDRGEYVQVSIIFNNEELRRHKILNKFYEKIRLSLYGRSIDVETFKIYLPTAQNDQSYFTFQGIYSGDLNISQDTIHGDIRPSQHNIAYYFMDEYHPVIFINTSNHNMSEKDNNNSIWKWEYQPFDKMSPVLFGTKSREEIEKQFSAVVPTIGRIIAPLIEFMEAKKTVKEDISKADKIKIITDEPTLTDVLDFNNYAKRLAQIIISSEPKFSIGIFGGWGTGKTTLMMMINNELKQYNKDKKKLLLVWFDAWKYEKEKYLAVIPLIRTIRIAIENNFSNRSLSIVRRGLDRTFAAFTGSTELNLGLQKFGSVQTNLSKFVDVLRSDGSIKLDNETINYHPHITDYLNTALRKVRKKHDFRIIIFVDDLDRCIPEKALEVLESIKIFFDINGIVFVIGMDPESIDDIVNVKYGERANISGNDYIQKIIQLPFLIPTWNETDISRFIEKIIIMQKDPDLVDQFAPLIHLLVKAVIPNPRQVKRFMNTIILAKLVFNKDVDKLLVVQALSFRMEWKRFLEYITIDSRRKFFLQQYKKFRNNDTNLEDSMNQLTNEMLKKSPAFKDIFDNNRSVLKVDDPLSIFLDAGAARILSSIDNMDDYLRALDTTRPGESYKAMEESDYMQKKFDMLSSNPKLAILLAEARVSATITSQVKYLSVLWVDDKPYNNEMIIRMYKEATNIEFDVATSTNEALHWLQKKHYKMVISDTKRGSENDAGFKMVEQIRNNIQDPPPIMIFSTQSTITEMQERINKTKVFATSSITNLISNLNKTLFNDQKSISV